jgi:hypothetical protein
MLTKAMEKMTYDFKDEPEIGFLVVDDRAFGRRALLTT